MLRKIFPAVVAVLALAPAFTPAQSPTQSAADHPLRVRIETDQEGLFRVRGSDLAPLTTIDRVQPDRLALTLDGKPHPIEIRGGADGRIDPQDEILFYAPPPAGNPANTRTFVLTDTGNPLRFKKDDGGVATSGDGVPSAVTQVFEKDMLFDPIATVRPEVVRGPARSHWYWAKVSVGPKGAVTLPIHLDARPIKAAPARVVVDVFGPCSDGVVQNLVLEINGQTFKSTPWDTACEKSVEFNIPGNVLVTDNICVVRNESAIATVEEPRNEVRKSRPNDLLIDRLTFSWHTALAGSSTPRGQIVFHIPAESAGGVKRAQFETRHQDGYLIVDGPGGRLTRKAFIDLKGTEASTVCVCGDSGAFEPKTVANMTSTAAHLKGPGGDWVAITTSRMKPAVDVLAAHRAAQGLKPVVVEARALYDTFTGGRFTPDAIRMFLAAATENWQTKPHWVVLVGDADLDCDFVSEKETLPTYLVNTLYNGATASDAAFSPLDAHGVPTLAIGRLTVRAPEDLVTLVQRIMAFENAPPPGAWRRSLAFFAGEGRFGVVADRLIESTVERLLSREIPPVYDVTMTYANPDSAWYYPASGFNGEVIRRFNGGSLVFTYIGHGYPEGFDAVREGGKKWPILQASDVAMLDCAGRAPIMSILACSTGQFDDPRRDCLAEKLLTRQGGPSAIIAASRISHPVANALLGQALVKAFFHEKHATRIGDILLEAKRLMVAEANGDLVMMASPFIGKGLDIPALLADHVHMYTLFGDPAMKVPYTHDLSGCTVPTTAVVGSTITVTGTMPDKNAADVAVTLDRPRSMHLGATTDATTRPTEASAGDKEAQRDTRRAARHARMNMHSVAATTAACLDGTFTATLQVPENLPPGDYLVTVYAAARQTDHDGDAMIARTITITSK